MSGEGSRPYGRKMNGARIGSKAWPHSVILRWAIWPLFVVGATAAAACPVWAAAGVSSPSSYRDSVGEDAAAADITRVVVSRGRGVFTFRVQIADRPTLTPDLGFQIVLDTDRNSVTGNHWLVRELGAEYEIGFFAGRAGLTRFSASGGWLPAAQRAVRFSYARGKALIAVKARALGDPTEFNFDVSSAAGMVPAPDGSLDITYAHFDFAPDAGHGYWSFPGFQPQP